MRVINVYNLQLQFDADRVTSGTIRKQAVQAIGLVNATLKRDQPFGLGAQLIAHPDEMDVEKGERDEV